MAKATRLTAEQIRTYTKPGKYGDGNGLYLSVQPGGTKSWSFRWTRHGKAHEMGLGPADHNGRSGGITLAKARQLAAEARGLLLQDQDPLHERRRIETENAVARARAEAGSTFEAVALAYIETRRPEWKNQKHVYQWEATLKSAFPLLGQKDVATITADDVFAVLDPIWLSKTETASRLRQRIEAVLDNAKARGLRTGDNPAAWKGNFRYRLPTPAKVQQQRQGVERRQPALPWRRMPAFWTALNAREETVSRLALQFLIVTAVRTNEVLGAAWDEFDLNEEVWTIPAQRMKRPAEHKVPLTPAMLAILDRAKHLNPPRSAGTLVFPGARTGRPLSDSALNMLVRGMNEEAARAAVAGGSPASAVPPFWHDERSKRAAVPHGFRSTYYDFGQDASDAGERVLDACLHHGDPDEVRGAYSRTQFATKRRCAHLAWESFLATGVVRRVVEFSAVRTAAE